MKLSLKKLTVENILTWFVYISPLILLFGGFLVFGKVPFFGFVTLLTVYFYLLALFLIIYLFYRPKSFSTLGRAFRVLLVLIIMIVFSAYTLKKAIDYDDSLFKFTYQLNGVLVVTAMTIILKNQKQLLNFLKVLTVCYIFLLIIGNIEVYSGFYIFSVSPISLEIRNEFGRSLPYTSFYNTNDFITFLAMFAPFIVYTLFKWFKGITSYVVVFVVSILLFDNILSGRARNSLITSICMLLVVFVIILSTKSLRKYIKKILSVGVAFPISYLILKLTQLSNGTLLNKIASVNGSDHSVGIRMKIAKAGFKMARDSGFTGVGVGNSVALMPSYTDLSPINMHNMPLQIFVEYGIIIFAVYLAMTVFVAKDYLRIKNLTSDKKLYCILSFLSVLSFQVLGMQPSDAMHITILWVIFGIWFVGLKVVFPEEKSKLIYSEKQMSKE